MNEITVAEGALIAAANHLIKARAELDREIGVLDRKLVDLGGQWAGGGAFAFVQLREQWQVKALGVIAELEKFERDLRDSKAGYDRVDQAAQTGLKRLENKLGALPGV